MTFVIEQTIEVTATPAVVWEVIVDLPRYGEWNPVVVEWTRSTFGCTSSRRSPHPQRETILAHVPGERLCSGLPANPLGSLASRRCHELQAMAGARTRYALDLGPD